MSVSKKSALRRWASRWSWLVWMLAASMVTSTDDSSGTSATLIEPEKVAKRPRTLVIMRWRATNSTVVWAWSRS